MIPEVSLRDIHGHDHEIGLLRRIVGKGLESGSLLLWGPEGVGKRTVALGLAREILCPGDQEGEACGKCDSCLTPLSRHPDFRFLDSGEEASIHLDRVREFVQGITELPLLSSLRVGIIDDAHRLTPQAANSLLKMIEEPPEKVLFFMVTSFPDSLLPTLRSRLLGIRFRPLSTPDLEKVARPLFPEQSGNDLAEAIALSGGSVARLSDLLGPSVRERQEKVRLFLGSLRKNRPVDQSGIAASWPFLSEKEGFDPFLDALERLLLSSERSLAGHSVDPSWNGSPLPRDYAGGIRDFRRAELHDRIGEMRRLMVYNFNRGLALEQFLRDLEHSFFSGSG